jgi:hypothetical protein
MRFYEYVENCKWENVQPIILAICKKRGPDKYIEQYGKREREYDSFKEVFDKLKRLKSIESDVIIQISVNEEEEEYSDGEAYIDVCCFEKDYEGRCGFCYPWDESLGMEITFKDGIRLSHEKIVANCLWEMTFWGFNWEEIVNRFNRSH